MTNIISSGEWGGYDHNVYYNPEKCGLKIVASVDADLAWEFDIMVIFKCTKTGSLWLARDSGCSCPTPFEDVRSFADFTPLRNEATLERAVKDLLDGYNPFNAGEIADFKRKGRAAIRARKKAAA